MVTSWESQKREWSKEWQARKAGRILQRSRGASDYRKFAYKGRQYVIRVADRSQGYQSDYKQVKTFFVLIYKDGVLIDGYTKTEAAYKAAEKKVDLLLQQA